MSRRIKKKPKPTDYDRLYTAIEFYREKIGKASKEALVIFNDILGDFANRLGETKMRRVKYNTFGDPFVIKASTFKFDGGEVVMAKTGVEHGSASLIDMTDEYDKDATPITMVEFLKKQQFKNMEDTRKYLGMNDSLLPTYLAYHSKSGENYELVSSFLEGVDDLEDFNLQSMLPYQVISLRCVLMVGEYVVVFSFNESRTMIA